MADPKVRTRFAPSPTGYLHIGGLRTALYSFALAKHYGGDYILRIEDTDQKREVAGATEDLQKILKTFDLDWDEYYVQSERQKTGIYRKTAEKLVNEGHAFYCQCPPKNAKDKGYSTELRDPCRSKKLTSGAVKLMVPDNKVVSYYDFVHKKEISWNTNEVYDATLLKSDGFPTYHLAVAVDDTAMNISHVLRGHDWLPSTPIHLLVFRYIGSKLPQIGHLTDILSAETGKKLSKRRDSVFVEQFLEEGYLPEALLNFVMLLGWAPKDNRELFTLEEFVKEFSEEGFQESNPKFLTEKLDWFNGYYIRQKTDEELTNLFMPYAPENADSVLLGQITPLIKERIKKLSDFTDIAGFFFERPKVDTSLFSPNGEEHITLAKKVLSNLENWTTEEMNERLMEEVKSNNFHTGKFFMDLRIAITGKKITPPLNDSMVILGKEETLARLAELH